MNSFWIVPCDYRSLMIRHVDYLGTHFLGFSLASLEVFSPQDNAEVKLKRGRQSLPHLSKKRHLFLYDAHLDANAQLLFFETFLNLH